MRSPSFSFTDEPQSITEELIGFSMSSLTWSFADELQSITEVLTGCSVSSLSLSFADEPQLMTEELISRTSLSELQSENKKKIHANHTKHYKGYVYFFSLYYNSIPIGKVFVQTDFYHMGHCQILLLCVHNHKSKWR